MKRRDVLRAAALSPLLATVEARAAGQAKFPGEEKLTRAKREVSEAMAKVRLDNADPPDLMPRPSSRRRK
jgi:hypothetical protein